jgi:predicted ATPase
MNLLKRIKLDGFRSIKNMDLELGPLNVLIGANGSGKSNLVAFLELMNELSTIRLQQFVARTGGANPNLHLGLKITQRINADLDFEMDETKYRYAFGLIPAAGSRLALVDEHLMQFNTADSGWQTLVISTGGMETTMADSAVRDVSLPFRRFFNNGQVFHFQDTSSTAPMLQSCFLGDNQRLRHNALNLAPMLYRWRSENAEVYKRIVDTVSLIAPFFEDFELVPDGNRTLMLKWKQRDSDLIWDPSSLSDGTLRSICLIALLLQPERDLPACIIVDEPELGLHPYAQAIIAGLFRAASVHTQVIISTQSCTFLDYFEPENVVVVERKKSASDFRRPPTAFLDDWLKDYSLGEIWQKNVIGGGPY